MSNLTAYQKNIIQIIEQKNKNIINDYIINKSLFSHNLSKKYLPVKNFEEFYSICNYGYLLSHLTKKPIFGENHWSNYRRVILKNSKTGEKRRTTIHKLIAEHFLTNPNPITHTEVDHIDRNVANNVVSNLEWVTKSENLKRRKTKPFNNKPIKIRAVKYENNKIHHNEIMQFDSINKACNELGVNPKSVKLCIDGVFEQTGGYKFYKIG